MTFHDFLKQADPLPGLENANVEFHAFLGFPWPVRTQEEILIILTISKLERYNCLEVRVDNEDKYIIFQRDYSVLYQLYIKGIDTLYCEAKVDHLTFLT